MDHDLDSSARTGTMASTRAEAATMATTEHRTVEDLDLAREAQKDRDAKAFFLFALTLLVITAIVGGAYLLLRDDPPAPAPPVDTTAQRAADEAAAIQTVDQLVAASDTAQAAGTLEGSGYTDVASRELVDDLEPVIENNNRGGYVYRGTTEVAAAKVISYESVTFQPGQRRIGLDVCLDISGVSVTDPAGDPVESVNPDGSPDDRTRLPVDVFVQTRSDGTYYVDSTLPAEDRTATC